MFENRYVQQQIHLETCRNNTIVVVLVVSDACTNSSFLCLVFVFMSTINGIRESCDLFELKFEFYATYITNYDINS